MDERPELKSGHKYDSEKSRVELVPVEAIEELGRLYGFGAKKYDVNNWRKGMLWSRIFGALLRHAFAFWRGEEIDKETGISHLIAVAWNAITLYMYCQEHREFDDRYKGNVIGENDQKIK